MSTFTLEPPDVSPTITIGQNGLDFGVPMYERYAPQRVADFAGLDEHKKKLMAFCKAPIPGLNFLFLGPPGLGKTRMGFAMSKEIPTEMHQIASRECDLESISAVISRCYYVPMSGLRLHQVHIDEVDGMTIAAQEFLLSPLDGTKRPPNTIFTFTANAVDKLHERFISRCKVLEFKPTWATTLEAVTRIWNAERDKRGLTDAQRPNLQQIARSAEGNVRDAIMSLEMEMMGL